MTNLSYGQPSGTPSNRLLRIQDSSLVAITRSPSFVISTIYKQSSTSDQKSRNAFLLEPPSKPGQSSLETFVIVLYGYGSVQIRSKL